jgi:inner membrane protein
MLSKTHLLVALLTGIVILQGFSLSHPFLFLLIFLFFTLLPDIDSRQSKIGRKAWPLSWLLSTVFGHRGLLHSIFVPIAILIASWYYGYLWVGYAAAGGYLVHLLCDAMTVGGIRFFGPFGWRTKGFFRTGGFIEALLFLALSLVLVWKIASLL